MWNIFKKSEFELKIRINEIRIADLNVKIQNTAEFFDGLYVQKNANLEKGDKYLKVRLETYEKSQSNTESF